MPRGDTPATKPLLDKLDVKAGMRVAVLGVADAAFREEPAARVKIEKQLKGGVDIVFLGVEGPDDMTRLAELKGWIARDGAVWVVYTARARRRSTRTTCCASASSREWST
jgi:hypothetical protein